MSETRTSGTPGLEERKQRGPVQRKGIGPGPVGWLDPRGRDLGHVAFVGNRVTGLGLVFYLYLHLAVLSMLLETDPAIWESAILRRVPSKYADVNKVAFQLGQEVVQA